MKVKREKNNMHAAWKNMVERVEVRIRLIKSELRGTHFTKLRVLRHLQRSLEELQHDATLLYRLRQEAKDIAYSRWTVRAATKKHEAVRKVPRRAGCVRCSR